MSAARQRWGAAAWLALCGVGRVAHGAALVALTVAMLAVAGAAALAWRLSQGPLEVGWLAQQVEQAMSPAGSRVQIGAATMRWPGFHAGAGHALLLALRDLRVVSRPGASGAAVAGAEVDVSVAGLVSGEGAARSIAVSGLRLRVVRAADGSVSVDLGGLAESGEPSGDLPSTAQVLAELGRPQGGESVLGVLARLGRVTLQDAVIELEDRGLDATAQVAISALDLQRLPGGGMAGQAAGRLILGGVEAGVRLDATLAEGGGTRIGLVLEPVGLAGLAGANPTLAPISALDAALEGTAELMLSPELRPMRAGLRAMAGAGRIHVKGADLAFERLALEGSADWTEGLRPSVVRVSRAQAVIASPGGRWSSTVGLDGEATRAGGVTAGRFALSLDHAELSDLPALWPAVWGGNVRPWLTENLTAGTVRDGALAVSWQAAEDLSSVKVMTAAGSLLGEDVTIHWLRPVPPIEHAQAVLTVSGPDVLDVAVSSGRLGGIALQDGSVRITGLSVKDQVLALSAGVTGPVPEIVTLLRHRRLHLLDRKPIYARTSAGSLKGRLTVDLPLEHDLQFEQVKIHAAGRLSGLRLGGLVAGRDLDRGEVQIDVTSDGLKASGTATVARIPGTLAVEMDFRPGGPSQVVQKANAVLRATPQQLAGAGLDPGGVIAGGSGVFNAAYAARRDGAGELRVQADLQDAALSLAGWRKAPGQAASASAVVVLRDDRLAGVDGLQAQGPGLRLAGRVDMDGERLGVLRLDRLVLGKTDAAGEVTFPGNPGDPIKAKLSGPMLDLSAALARKPGGGTVERDAPWVADVRFERVLLAEARGLSGVTAHAEHDGVRLRRLHAESGGPEAVRVEIVPQGAGRRLTASAGDGGAALRALDVMDTVQGGRLTLEGMYDDRRAAAVLSGTAGLSGFTLRNAPVLGKMLQAATIYGVVDALRGPGLAFSQFTLPFRYDGDVLEVQEARAFSTSLGLTGSGVLDLARKTVDVKGTVVPAYVLNSLLGRLPLVGRVFSPERGGGLLAVNYAVRGALADPGVSVNPLSALTPGFLRGLFKIFD